MPDEIDEGGTTDSTWTDALLARAKARSAASADAPESSAPTPPVEGRRPPEVVPDVPSTSERPALATRADIEGGTPPSFAPPDDTFVSPSVPSVADQALPGPEPVDLGIPGAAASTRRALIEWGSVLAGALVLAIVVRTFLFGAYYIPSPSMEPTLSVGDRIIVNKVSYRLHDVNRGDLVVFRRTGPAVVDGIDDMIKRVIGLPGEMVTAADGRIRIDGGLLIEPYLSGHEATGDFGAVPWCANGGMGKCTVPAGHVFVMGDNRANSRDSRYIGPIPIESIAGRAFVRFWPLGSLDRL